MHGRVDAHRRLVRVLGGDVGVHVEEVAVLLADIAFAAVADGVGEVEVDAAAALADAAALVAHLLGRARRDVARRQVAETRVFALQIIVAVAFGDLGRRPPVAGRLGHPNAAVVAQRLRHERQLRLVFAGHGDAGRVDLRVAGVGETGAALVGAIGRRDVAIQRVGGQVKDWAVAAGGQHHGVADVRLDFAGDEVPRHDAARPAVDDDDVEHFRPRVHADVAHADLTAQRLVGAEQQLLAGLSAAVEGARHLGAAEGAVVEQAAVLARRARPGRRTGR